MASTKPRMPKSAHEALQSMYATEIGQRLKVLENAVNPVVQATQTYVIRLDGVAFHTLLKGVNKPFDTRIGESMVQTTMDLMQRFSATTAYTQSDEISLVFPNVDDVVSVEGEDTIMNQADDAKTGATTVNNGTESATATNNSNTKKDKKRKRQRQAPTHAYSGRIQKLASVTASYAAARFNHHLASHTYTDLAPQVSERLHSGTAYFDARVIPCTSPKDAMECIFWRSNFDGLRNAVHAIGQSLFHHKELQNKSIVAQIDMCWNLKQYDVFEKVEKRYLYGVWIKKEVYELVGAVHPKTGQLLEGVMRHRLRRGSFNWADWSEVERISFVMEKLWMDGERSPPKDDLLLNGAVEAVESHPQDAQENGQDEAQKRVKNRSHRYFVRTLSW
ncbi:hypothetical protein SmJEL517_g05461 [Synchytrium microbalum]|uniref:tRNA(His) guanylyltransferase n=1 Tax=Synchytrium microbalum TaxID=1806994 RepID=A0A507BZH3_9FUNG|nr:uncharacterized protein SmJEL517_g05461 [Synchytrium microbalum]TPX31146.1 hypothetical protein SmJEL517_g05461 [Synchytrium microbalum]